MTSHLLKIRKNSSEFLLIGGMIGILIVLFTPIPPLLLDFLLLLNFSLAMMILLITFQTEKPLSFSTFPSLLLVTTLFRLSLNVTATRLILSDGHAGQVIDAVGSYVVSGNYVIGLVIFFILIVVQYVVVTNGAQRVAEVAARFTLDSLPGKQMSVDADLNMGIIDQEEAKKRRGQLEKEANFYGAMDGASKFVKGDAIAGIIIILINIIGGLTIGMLQKGMPWSIALERYTLLTIGDGIVTQIPSLIVAVAAGIIITRAATDSRLGKEISDQFTSHPKAMIVVLAILMPLSLLPGVPILPLIILSGLIGTAAYLSSRSLKHGVHDSEMNKKEKTDLGGHDEPTKRKNHLSQHELTIVFGTTLFQQYSSSVSELKRRIDIAVSRLSDESGFTFPEPHVIESPTIPKESYEIRIFGSKVAGSTIEIGRLLAINTGSNLPKLNGTATNEPAYGLPAVWINIESSVQAKTAGYAVVDSETVVVTHIQEVIRSNRHHLLTRKVAERLIDEARQTSGALVDEIIPNLLSIADIQSIFQSLIKEDVSIENIEQILEALADHGRHTKSPDDLVEHVRAKLSMQICDRLSNGYFEIHVMTLSPDIEIKVMTSNKQSAINQLGVTPDELDRLISQVAMEARKMIAAGRKAVLLCNPTIRRLIRNLLIKAVPQLHVISASEITQNIKVISHSLITVKSQSSSGAAG